MRRMIVVLLLAALAVPAAAENLQDPLVKIRLAIEAEQNRLRQEAQQDLAAVEVPVPVVDKPVVDAGIPAAYRGALLMLLCSAVMMSVVYVHTRT